MSPRQAIWLARAGSALAAMLLTVGALALVAWMNRPDAKAQAKPAAAATELPIYQPRQRPPEPMAPRPPAARARASDRALAAPAKLQSPSALPRLGTLHGVEGSTLGGMPALGLGLPSGAARVRTSVASRRTAPARPLRRPAPIYPGWARRRGIQGFVVVRLSVDARGHVTRVAVVASKPSGVFDDVARRTALRYRFEPALRDGKAVATTLEQRIVFRLQR